MIGYLALTAPWSWVHEKDTVQEQERSEQSPFRLHGYPHPTVFKTVRNALRAAGPNGYVVVLDLHRLPLVHLKALPPADIVAVSKSWKKEIRHRNGRWDHVERVWIHDYTPDEEIELPPQKVMLDVEIGHDDAEDIYMQHQLAERQALLWAERLDNLTELIKRQGPG